MERDGQGTRQRASGFFSLPSTFVGRWSGYLLLLGIALVALNTAVIMPVTESRAGLNAVQMVVNVVVGSCVVASGVLGAFAVLVKRERSWASFLAIAILTLIGMMMAEDLASAGHAPRFDFWAPR